MAVEELKKTDKFDQLVSYRGLTVVHFWAPWSEPCKQMAEAMEDLAKEYLNSKFIKIEAEEFPEISLKYEVVAVPTFLLFKAGKVVDTLNGAHVPELAKKTAAHSQTMAPPQAAPAEKEDLDTRLKKLINAADCMLFIKGTSEEPKCGFSRQTVALLNECGTKFSTFNILADDEVRQGLKKYSNWPTYPQLYVKGELLGGLDILKEMKENGELEEILPKRISLDDRLKSLTNKAPIMLFMKGSPEEPQCGFSRTVCGILQECGATFETFDILSDDKVRQGLKKFSNWPTYPQLYVKGELIGGLDILKELKESDELLSTLGLSE
nr:glutaredoxin 3 [Halichondria panicea]